MKIVTAIALAAGLLMAPALFAEHAVDGKWKASVETPRGTQDVTFDFKEEDGKLTGTVSNPRGESKIEDGKVEGNAISFKQTMSFGDRSMTLSYSGTLDGDEIEFTRTMEGRGRTSKFTAKRKQ